LRARRPTATSRPKRRKARTIKLVAEIARKTAELDAQATVTLGEADASAQQLLEEAKAEKFKLAVGAFGSGPAYNQWVFASGLPTDIKLQLLYAGPGTFWTDLKGFSDVRNAGKADAADAGSGRASSQEEAVIP